MVRMLELCSKIYNVSSSYKINEHFKGLIKVNKHLQEQALEKNVVFYIVVCEREDVQGKSMNITK